MSGTEFAPTHEVDGWRRAPVSVHWNWSDATSGVDPGDCPQLSTFRHQGTHNVFTTCYDIAGNSNQAGAEVKVDASSPKIRIMRPLHHRYVRGAVVRGKYRCGLKACCRNIRTARNRGVNLPRFCGTYPSALRPTFLVRSRPTRRPAAFFLRERFHREFKKGQIP